MESIDDQFKKKVRKYAKRGGLRTKISQCNEEGESGYSEKGTMESIFGCTSDPRWNWIIKIEWNLRTKYWD